MISILIPTYNYKITELVNSIHKQLELTNVPFEIIVLEDGSTQPNVEISPLDYTSILRFKENKGRVKARQVLAQKAKFDWLLFLDADVLPKNSTFIVNYLECLPKDYDAVFGGFYYYNTPPETSLMLRWKYGKTKEQVPAIIRNKTPFKIIISANCLIKKEVFTKINTAMNQKKGYGYDNFFGALLKENNCKVLHLDNEVYHLGIEESTQYLNKNEHAALTLLKLKNAGNIVTHDNDLLKLFIKIEANNLIGVGRWFYKLFGASMKKQLIGNNPNITILQVYRISYMCFKARKTI
ncbi:glycosyltransferase family 2 protein [Bizionia gelidisalsuginis]|uniref:Glycosyltransferase family 2 protein n=2 Tax=Bizionia TaxID=283785 RepID=A0A8H2QFD4_9FLAO|nr:MULTISPECIES: glycosyltransferase family 2 protein [Bizionia]TYB74520.1 glycosyltransferase family 2 protein [Bizionia saleffrena]TYC16312.1 glycosyltransferase family 2 protein [Bizionia gelidisalsuginis]